MGQCQFSQQYQLLYILLNSLCFFVNIQFSIVAFTAKLLSLYAHHLLICMMFNMIYVMLDGYSVMLTKHLLGDVVMYLLCCVRMMSPVL